LWIGRNSRSQRSSSRPRLLLHLPGAKAPVAWLCLLRWLRYMSFGVGGATISRSYSAQWRSSRDLARWRDEHVSYRGVYFGRWGFWDSFGPMAAPSFMAP